MTGSVRQSAAHLERGSLFERLVLGEEYWASRRRPIRFSIRPGAPMADSLVRGEIAMGPCSTMRSIRNRKDGAADQDLLPTRGRAGQSLCHGNSETAAHPNAAKLFLNWCLSKEVADLHDPGAWQPHSLKEAPVYPEGFDPKVVKVWLPKFDDYVEAAPLGCRLGQDLRLPAVIDPS